MRLCVLAALLALVGCGVPDPDGSEAAEGETGGDSGTGDDPEPVQALPDIDLDEWCGDVDGPAFDLLDANSYLLDLGPCGHIVSRVYDDGVSHWLTNPDGTREPLELPSTMFDATGRLLFLYDPQSPLVELHDLGSGLVHAFEAEYAYRHGFVRSADPEHPTAAWVCDVAGRLSAVVGDQTVELMTGITLCEGVRGSEGNSKLLVPQGELLYVIDVDTGERLPTEIDDYVLGYDEGMDGERLDRLEMNYAGSLAIHELIIGYPHDSPLYTMERRIIDVARGRIIETCDERPSLYQAPTQHAPAFAVCDGRLSLWYEDELLRIGGGVFAGLRLSESDAVVFAEAKDQYSYEVFWVSAQDPSALEPIVILENGYFPMISAGGEAIAYDNPTDVCADADCTEYLHELGRWTADGGPAAPLWGAGYLYIELVRDDGSVLVWGILVEGPVDGALPEPTLSLIDETGQLVRQWKFGGDELHDSRLLADGRLFVTTGSPPAGDIDLWTVDIADLGSEPTHVLGPFDADGPELDGQRRRAAVQTPTELYWGAL